MALTCPSSEEPTPNGTTGARWRAAGGDDRADTSSVVSGKHDDVGRARGVPRFAVAVMLELRGVRGAAIAEQRLQIGRQRGPCRV